MRRSFLFYIVSLTCFILLYGSYAKAQKTGNQSFVQNSVLATGDWYRISVDKTGIYVISYSDLLQWGINPTAINPKNIKIYGNGGAIIPEANYVPIKDDLSENAIFVMGESDGVFNPGDYILFYATSPVSWNYESESGLFLHTSNIYSDVSDYFINISDTQGKRILKDTVELNHNFLVSTFNDYAFHEKDSINLLKSGKEWYGEYFNYVKTYSFLFPFPDIVENSKVKIKSNIAARNTVPTVFNVNSGNFMRSVVVSAIPGQYTADYARFSTDTFSFVANNPVVNLNISMETEASIGWLNFFDVNCERQLKFSGHQLAFRNTESILPGRITRFDLDYSFLGTKIWDVSDPFNAKEKAIAFFLNNPGIVSRTDSLMEFIAFDSLQYLHPVFIDKIKNQNLHALQPKELIILAYPDFVSQAERLALLHEQYDQISSLIVTPQEIYNEFSSGIQDVSAIKNFMRMLYFKAQYSGVKPKYLLLIGDGSYDYKNRISENTNFIPTYESNNSLMPTSSYLSDDYFGLLDSSDAFLCNGNLDIGIGRFPCVKVDEVKAIVDKIEKYLKRDSHYSELNGCTLFESDVHGDWRNTVCFIGDDEDNNLHLSQANDLATIVDTTALNINVRKIYLDAYKQQTNSSGQTYPEVNKLINDQVNQGALLINYTGHGGEDSWAEEKIIQFSDIYKWKNLTNLPVFVTATCEFSRFDDPSRHSAGELILTKQDGGGIGLFTTTRLAFSNSNFSLNKSFYKFAFKRDSLGNYFRMGDIIRLAKVDNNSIVNVRNFVLLGDPALQLSYPQNIVKTLTINGVNAELFSDTLKQGSIVSVTGLVEDYFGNQLSDFNGTLYPTVFDQKEWMTTLGNDPQSIPYNFTVQDKALYKGKVTVQSGEFAFSFIIPKDIAPTSGSCKISYYAEDKKTNATGYFETTGLILCGSDTYAFTDTVGPLIQPFLNNTAFVPGGVTDPNPLLKIYLSDVSGVNAFNVGIGHEIVCELDSDSYTSIILNNYFEPDFNSYQSGWVSFPLKNLEFGKHQVLLKAWDLMNNYSEKSFEFIVSPPADLSIRKIAVYPNPFSDKTYFYFEHNQPCCEMNLQIDICSLSGQKVKQLNKTIIAGTEGIVIQEWDGTSDNGSNLSNGMYVFRLKAQSADGSYMERSGKLVISR